MDGLNVFISEMIGTNHHDTSWKSSKLDVSFVMCMIVAMQSHIKHVIDHG